MNRRGGSQFWPFGTRAALITTGVMIVVLLTAAVLVRLFLQWPPNELLGVVLLAAVLVGLVPVFLLVLDRVADGGQVTILGLVDVAFAAADRDGAVRPSVHVSENLGALPGVAVHDSGGGNIMAALSDAVAGPVAVVDLGRGEAWWESRLLLLLTGAARLGRPRAVVFVATRHRAPQQFIGWGEPAELVRCMLEIVDGSVREALSNARARALRWQLQEPGQPVPAVPAPSIPDTTPRGLEPEALLMSALAGVEAGPRPISIARLQELVGPVLYTASIEQTATEDDKLKAVLATTGSYLAVVDGGRFTTVMPRDSAVNAVLQVVLAMPAIDPASPGQPASTASSARA
jgi:hypothetical protein